MKPSAPPSAARPSGSPRRHLTRLLQSSLLRLGALTDEAICLRERIANMPAYSTLCTQIDGLLRELQGANRQLATRAAKLGAKVRHHAPPPRTAWIKSARIPADLVAYLAKDCRTCGTRLCALLQAAQVAADVISARIAYSLVRTLEKQLWLLSPHTEGSAHPFVLSTRTA